MSDEAYPSLSWSSNEPNMLPSNKFLGIITNILVQNINPVETDPVLD